LPSPINFQTLFKPVLAGFRIESSKLSPSFRFLTDWPSHKYPGSACAAICRLMVPAGDHQRFMNVLATSLMDGPLTPRREETVAGFSSVPQGKRRWNG
jgi:hypothetical protein